MKERVFLDTNVLVYLFDADDPAKQRRVQDLLSNREVRARLILSTQVLQEFYVSVTRKLATPLEQKNGAGYFVWGELASTAIPKA
jgi:predicted nucleic acid-binding protein